jgi:hypothetical protein
VLILLTIPKNYLVHQANDFYHGVLKRSIHYVSSCVSQYLEKANVNFTDHEFITLEQFCEWYVAPTPASGHEIIPWIELLAFSKWPLPGKFSSLNFVGLIFTIL